MIIRRIAREERKKRVCAYCRVSTKLQTQAESYDTQVRVYKEMIRNNPMWEYAGVYADPGITGTSAEKRPDFLRMIQDAKEKKLDIILCKSISRFARNAIETQKYVEILRENSVVVIFEENGIRTDDPGANFVFSLLASVAQDESRSISENVKWSIQQKFARGEYNLGSHHILGYDTMNGKLVPNDQAWIVREIFTRFLNGESYKQISDHLVAMGARSMRGKDEFSAAAIRAVLKNEAYKGDMRLQKKPPVNYLTKKPDTSVNYRTYYLTGDHEAIVDRDIWEAVQEVFEHRHAKMEEGIVAGDHHPLYGKVFCAECGAPYVRRTLKGSGGEYHKAWNCRERQKGKCGNGCKNRTVKEDELAEYTGIQRVLITRKGIECIYTDPDETTSK